MLVAVVVLAVDVDVTGLSVVVVVVVGLSDLLQRINIISQVLQESQMLTEG